MSLHHHCLIHQAVIICHLVRVLVPRLHIYLDLRLYREYGLSVFQVQYEPLLLLPLEVKLVVIILLKNVWHAVRSVYDLYVLLDSPNVNLLLRLILGVFLNTGRIINDDLPLLRRRRSLIALSRIQSLLDQLARIVKVVCAHEDLRDFHSAIALPSYASIRVVLSCLWLVDNLGCSKVRTLL